MSVFFRLTGTCLFLCALAMVVVQIETGFFMWGLGLFYIAAAIFAGFSHLVIAAVFARRK